MPVAPDRTPHSGEFAEHLAETEANPVLTWPGKHPLHPLPCRPPQLRESYGVAADGWMNRLYRGDNLQVMSHLLEGFRGKVDLVYIDPPFNSNAGYASRVHPKGRPAYPFLLAFDETQFDDIWSRDEYLQFMYERLILIRELLSDRGSVFVHCDRRSNHLLRCLLDEVFGESVEEEGSPGLVNEIVWHRQGSQVKSTGGFAPRHDTIFWHSKTGNPYSNVVDPEGSETPGTVWCMDLVKSGEAQATGYPTQKPEALLERIIRTASAPGSIVLDCFMGSGTAGAVAMRAGRRFIGVDANPAAVHTVTKRLLRVASELESPQAGNTLFTGFEVHDSASDRAKGEPDCSIEADIALHDGKLVIRSIRPANLIRRLGVGEGFFEDWRELADSVFIDWDYDGAVLRPDIADMPLGDGLVEGSYAVPEGAGAIRVKIVDVLSEPFETDVSPLQA